MKSYLKAALPLSFAALLLAGCSSGEPAPETAENVTTAEKASHAEEEGVIDLSPEQIRKAGIELVRVVRSGGGALTLPATIEGDPQGMQVVRSEEHTSELQSLMRSSYAVFCLKKKTH